MRRRAGALDVRQALLLERAWNSGQGCLCSGDTAGFRRPLSKFAHNADALQASAKTQRAAGQSRQGFRHADARDMDDHGAARRTPSKRGRGRVAEPYRRGPRFHRHHPDAVGRRAQNARIMASPRVPLCRIEVDAPWDAALDGIEAIERLEVFYWLHQARRDLVRQSPGRNGVTEGDLHHPLAGEAQSDRRLDRDAGRPRRARPACPGSRLCRSHAAFGPQARPLALPCRSLTVSPEMICRRCICMAITPALHL